MAKKQDPKPKPVPVTRVKKISDSLAMTGLSKFQISKDLSKQKGTAAKKLSTEFKKSSDADFKKSNRLDSIASKAVADSKNKKKKY